MKWTVRDSTLVTNQLFKLEQIERRRELEEEQRNGGSCLGDSFFIPVSSWWRRRYHKELGRYVSVRARSSAPSYRGDYNSAEETDRGTHIKRPMGHHTFGWWLLASSIPFLSLSLSCHLTFKTNHKERIYLYIYIVIYKEKKKDSGCELVLLSSFVMEKSSQLWCSSYLQMVARRHFAKESRLLGMSFMAKKETIPQLFGLKREELGSTSII